MPTRHEITTREAVYKHIRNALIDKSDNPFQGVDMESPVFQPLKETVDVSFAQEFTRVGGKFVYCEHREDLGYKLQYIITQNKLGNIFCFDPELIQLLQDFEISFSDNRDEILQIQTGITSCECLIARTGSIIVSSKQFSGRKLYALPDTLIVIASTDQILTDLKDGLQFLKKKYPDEFPSAVTVITGPSRTADIEKTLVMGAHGPAELYVFLVESS